MPAALQSYLDELDVAARGLRRSVRADLQAEVWGRVAGLAGPAPTPERLAAALAQIGAPAELVAQRTEGSLIPLRARGDLTTVHLLGASALTLGVGSVVGLFHLWRRGSWTLADRIQATCLVLAGAVALPLLTPLSVVPAVVLGGLALGPALAACHLLLIRSVVGLHDRLR